MLPAFAFGLFTWLSFFLVGYRERRRDWMLTGAGYAVFSALAFFAFSRNEVSADDTADTLVGFAVLLAWLGGAVHVLLLNAAILRSPAGVAPAEAAPPAPAPAGWPAAPAAPAGADAGLGLGNPAGDYLADGPPERGLPPPPEAPVEANTATPRVLATLPGVTPALARRWVAERRRRGGFRDLDDLAGALDLQPHQIVGLRPRVSFAAPAEPPKRRRLAGRGRVLDV